MHNLELLFCALEYMEAHLQEDIRTEDIAANCFCSKSTLEKLFRCVNHISVRDYLVRRRISKAGRALLEDPQISILEIALQFGYGSNEAFTRAFRQVWNCKPSDFRKKHRISDIYPRLNPPAENGGDTMTTKHFDISELYDLFKQRKDCYFVCCDIAHLTPINEISRKAGDLAILEAIKRMEEAAGEHDYIFRIGGDEFAILTSSPEIDCAEEIAGKLRERSGECFTFEDRQIPLMLRISLVKQNGNSNIKYDELFTRLHDAIKQSTV